MKALDSEFYEVVQNALEDHTAEKIAEAADTYPCRVREMATGRFRPNRETREKLEDFTGESLTVEV